MTATLLVTKGGAALVLRPAFGFSADEVRLAFGLTVPQAAATLAAVLVGVEVGLFDGAILNGTIAMVSVTCLVGPVVVERAGRRLAARAEAEAPAARGPRVLVSVANPATVGPLVDLGLLVRGGGPLAAVTVVTPGLDRDHAVGQAERLLDAATEHAAGADVPVLPLVRVETNVARALARAAAETRSALVVMGWDGSPAAARVLFGGVTDRVLAETTAAVLIARETRPTATVRRLLVAVPPLAEEAPGFSAGARTLAALAARVGAGLVVVTTEGSRETARAAFARKGRPPEVVALARWRDLADALDGLRQPGDALALVSDRPGGASWRASLDNLPRALAERFSDVSLLVLYPGRVPSATAGAVPLPAGGAEAPAGPPAGRAG